MSQTTDEPPTPAESIHHHHHRRQRQHPFVTLYTTTRLIFHQQCVEQLERHRLCATAEPKPASVSWSTIVWLRLAHQFVRKQTFDTAATAAAMQPHYQLVPIPSQLYAILTAAEFLQSDHYAIVPESTHDQLVANKDEHWRNLVFVSADTNTARCVDESNVAQAILKKPNATVMVSVLAVPEHTPMQPNCVFVSEMCYQNCVAKFRLDSGSASTEPPAIMVQLQPLQPMQNAPMLATKATIFTVNQPNDIANDIVAEILSSYFRQPRILYRNYTYEIRLDAQLLGPPFWARHLQLFHRLRSLYVRCVHLESADNAFELAAVVVRGRTELQQTTSINVPLPRRHLHALCPGVSALPAGLERYATALHASMVPFVAAMTSGGGGVSSGPDDQPPANTQSSSSSSAMMMMPLILLQGERGAGKMTVVHAVAASIGMQVMVVDCADIVSQIAAQTEAKLRVVLARARMCRPLVVALTNFELFGVDGDGREDHRTIGIFEVEMSQFFAQLDEVADERRLPVVVLGVSNGMETKPLIRRLFVDAVRVEPLDKGQRAACLRWLHTVRQCTEAVHGQRTVTVPLCGQQKGAEYLARFSDIDELLLDVADRTPGFLFGDVKLLYARTVVRCGGEGAPTVPDRAMFDANLTEMQALFADSLGAPKVPKVLWSDIGGLSKLKEEIQTSIGMPLKHLHLMGKNMRRSGILLYGPPGTGKTLVAKAVATECGLSFLSVQGPELLNMYVGQSEQNVREVFARARSAAPCVVFLDELDSLAPNRGMAGDSGGVMDRVVSQLMTEMNGMAENADPTKPLFILAATNRPDLIDPSLLRPGRFDKLLYVGPCTTTDEKMAVFDTQTKKFNLDTGLDRTTIAKLLPASMTGADMYSICSNAWLSAVRRTIGSYESARRGQAKSVTPSSSMLAANDGETELGASDVIVYQTDFEEAVRNFVPSVSEKDMAYFTKLKASYSV